MHPAVVPFLLGFAVGSIPAAWLVVRLATKQDVVREGSGNVGAANALRVTRSKWVGIAVLVLDACKGAAAVWLAVAWQGGWAVGALGWATVGAVAGHNFNPWLSIATRRLAGGKGFAAAAGALLVFRPLVVAGWLLTCLVAWLGFRRARGITDDAPASVIATIAMIPAAWLLYDAATAWTCAGINLLCVPKILPELPAVFAEARARKGQDA